MKAPSERVTAAARSSGDDDDDGDAVQEECGGEQESSRLRGQLLHVLVDHQRQEEEIVALRALARSLKEEVEQIQKQNPQTAVKRESAQSRSGSHEYFKLDLQLEQLRTENSRLHDELCDSKHELGRLRAFVDEELPQHKIAAVQARAELECVSSQLQDEQAHSDHLRAQVAYYKARTNDPIRVTTPFPPLRNEEPSSSSGASGYTNDQYLQMHKRQVHAETEQRRREREAFLLQCRMSAIQEDKENHSELRNSEKEPRQRGGQMRDECGSSLKHRKKSECGSSSSSSGASSRSPSLSSSQVHRDLSSLNHELHELHLSLQQLPTTSKMGP